MKEFDEVKKKSRRKAKDNDDDVNDDALDHDVRALVRESSRDDHPSTSFCVLIRKTSTTTMTSSWLLTSIPFRRRAFGKKGRRRRRRNGSSGGEKAWSLLLLLFPRRRLGARGSRRHHISLYTLYTTQKRIRSRVFFWCVFGELFWREIFFSLFFVLFSSKAQQTRSILDRHTL